MLLFGLSVSSPDLLEPLVTLLLANQFVFHFLLMAVASLKQFLSFLVGDIG